MRVFVMAFLLALALGFGCNTKECPLGTDLNGSEFPCLCKGKTLDALPGNGQACQCDKDKGFTCGGSGSGDAGAGE